jgi:hypothetical protein
LPTQRNWQESTEPRTLNLSGPPADRHAQSRFLKMNARETPPHRLVRFEKTIFISGAFQ